MDKKRGCLISKKEGRKESGNENEKEETRLFSEVQRKASRAAVSVCVSLFCFSFPFFPLLSHLCPVCAAMGTDAMVSLARITNKAGSKISSYLASNTGSTNLALFAPAFIKECFRNDLQLVAWLDLIGATGAKTVWF
jgi:hypothetical protein